MALPFELVLVALLVLVLNVLDSVSTQLCFTQYPDKELKGEGNPFMRKLMLKRQWLAEAIKHVVALGIVAWLVLAHDLATMRLLATMLGLVVLNNTFIVVSRAITKRKVATPIARLIAFLRVPEKYGYAVAIVTIWLLAMGICQLAWG